MRVGDRALLVLLPHLPRINCLSVAGCRRVRAACCGASGCHLCCLDLTGCLQLVFVLPWPGSPACVVVMRAIVCLTNSRCNGVGPLMRFLTPFLCQVSDRLLVALFPEGGGSRRVCGRLAALHLGGTRVGEGAPLRHMAGLSVLTFGGEALGPQSLQVSRTDCAVYSSSAGAPRWEALGGELLQVSQVGVVLRR